MQPFPQCGPEPAGRPNLGPEGRRSKGEARRSWRGCVSRAGSDVAVGTLNPLPRASSKAAHEAQLSLLDASTRHAGSSDGCLQGPQLRPCPWPRPRTMGAQALARSPAGLAAPSVSSAPSRAKILGCDGWGPRAPPRIPSRFPGPRVGLGSSLQPSLPRVAGQAGPPGQAYRRQAALLWPEYPAGQGSVPKPPGASLDSSPIPGGLWGSWAQASPSFGMHLPGPLLPPLRTLPQAGWKPLSSPPSQALLRARGLQGGTSAGQDASSQS